MENITEKEMIVLRRLEEEIEDVWISSSEFLCFCQDYKLETVRGVIGSLVKKGLVISDTDEGSDWLRITTKGRTVLF